MRHQVILAIASACLTLLCVEVGFRAYGRIYSVDFRLYAKELKNSDRLPEDLFGDPLNSGVQVLATTSDFSVLYSVNSHGLRDREHSYEKPPGITRFAVFGDSFTFGEGIPYGKRFTDIAEENLPGTEILNFGYPGAGLDNIVPYIFREGLLYRPDYVVVVLNNLVTDRGGADLTDILNFSAIDSAYLASVRGASTETAYLPRKDPFFNYSPNILQRNSYLASYLYYKYSIYELREKMKQYDKEFWDGYAQCRKSPDCDRMQQTDVTDHTIKILDKLNDVCRQSGHQLVAINIDSEPLVHFYQTAPPFPFFDLHQKLKEESANYPLTFTYDQHYNEKTNEFIGKELTGIVANLIRDKK